MADAAASPNRSRALLELLRLPNVFTAWADVGLGFLFMHESAEPRAQLVLLAIASG